MRDATRAAEPCPQLGEPEEPPVVGAEDCLYLNVDTPRAAAGPLPVLVFLHGGGFTGGRPALYGPGRIVHQGQVIVVTVGFRLGALGFLDHPALTDPYAGNFGLADQQAALRWVRQNIAAFGGDPRNVTLWGQSAGAASVCAQLAAPAARGLFHKAIVQSGSCGNDLKTRPVAQQRGLDTAARLGCPDPRTAVDCLRRKPFEQLTGLFHEQERLLYRHIAEMPWRPVAGTPAIPLQPLTSLRRGLAARVPLIHGGTRDEMRIAVAINHDFQGRPVTPAEYPEIVRALFGNRQTGAILDRYPLADYPSPSLALATLLTDYGGVHGACSQLPAIDAAARRAPVYAYEFAELSTDVAGALPLGAYHGYDVRYLFGRRGAPSTPNALSDRMIGYWTAFARTADPGPDWSRYRAQTALSISATQVGLTNVAREHQCDFWRSLPR